MKKLNDDINMKDEEFGSKILADNLWALGIVHHLNPDKLAAIMGISEHDLKVFFRSSEKKLGKKELERLGKYFDCSYEVFLSDETDVKSFSAVKNRFTPYARGFFPHAVSSFLKENSGDEGASDVLLRRGFPQAIRNTLLLSSKNTEFRGELYVYARNRLGIGRSAYSDKPYLEWSCDCFKHYMGLYFDNERRYLLIALHYADNSNPYDDEELDKYRKIINKSFFDNMKYYEVVEIKKKREFDEEQLVVSLWTVYRRMFNELCKEQFC